MENQDNRKQIYTSHINEQLQEFNSQMKELCTAYDNPYIKYFLIQTLRNFKKYSQSNQVGEYPISPLLEDF